jgi:hypothetical protein
MQKAYDEIVYLDETTFNLWHKQSKCWLAPGMKLQLVKNRGPSITAIGAISRERGLVHLEVFVEGNNAERFQTFLIGLKNRCHGRRVLVVMDNLRVHHSKILDAVFDQDFKPMYLPLYSCELNPIETLWAVVKKKWA